MHGVRMLRRAAGRVVLVGVASALLQTSTWALWGRRILVRRVPDMVRADASIRRASGAQAMKDGAEHGQKTWTIRTREGVIPRRYVALLGPSVIERSRVAYGESGSLLYVEPDVPARLGYRRADLGYDECDDCLIVEPDIRHNTPLFASVVISYSLAPDSATFYEHRLMWCFGFWVMTSARLGGAT